MPFPLNVAQEPLKQIASNFQLLMYSCQWTFSKEHFENGKRVQELFRFYLTISQDLDNSHLVQLFFTGPLFTKRQVSHWGTSGGLPKNIWTKYQLSVSVGRISKVSRISKAIELGDWLLHRPTDWWVKFSERTGFQWTPTFLYVYCHFTVLFFVFNAFPGIALQPAEATAAAASSHTATNHHRPETVFS